MHLFQQAITKAQLLQSGRAQFQIYLLPQLQPHFAAKAQALRPVMCNSHSHPQQNLYGLSHNPSPEIAQVGRSLFPFPWQSMRYHTSRYLIANKVWVAFSSLRHSPWVFHHWAVNGALLQFLISMPCVLPFHLLGTLLSFLLLVFFLTSLLEYNCFTMVC